VRKKKSVTLLQICTLVFGIKHLQTWSIYYFVYQKIILFFRKKLYITWMFSDLVLTAQVCSEISIYLTHRYLCRIIREKKQRWRFVPTASKEGCFDCWWRAWERTPAKMLLIVVFWKVHMGIPSKCCRYNVMKTFMLPQSNKNIYRSRTIWAFVAIDFLFATEGCWVELWKSCKY
jgi:hypothetical protein